MRIKLITPRFHSRHFWDFDKMADFLGRKANNLQLALPTVAALTPDEHEVTLLDDRYMHVDFDEPVDLVGLTAMTCYANRAFEIADEFRKRGVPVVMGGPHATLAPYESLEHVDAVVIGEAENVWEQLLNDFQAGEMKEVYRGVDNRADLAERTPPRWGLVPATDYVFFGVEATRGCPFDCSFCSIKQIYGPSFRTRDVEQVLDEIKAAPGNQLFFTDDNLIGNKPFCNALFDAMEGWNVSWGCQMSINVAFMPKMLEKMKKAGCFFIFIGFETLDDHVVDNMGKPVNRLDYRKAIANIQSYGIHVIGSFILGTDSDDDGVFKRIGDFAQEVSMSWMMVNIINSPPGTKLLAQMEEEGRNVVYSYDELDGAHATVRHPVMTRETIEAGFRWLYRHVYDWDNMRERFTKSLAQGTWTQNAITLGVFEKAKIGMKLGWDFMTGGAAKRRFFLAMLRQGLRRTVNKESVINVLMMAMSFNEFANALEARPEPVGEPIQFRPEYSIPVDEQEIGRNGTGSGVVRDIPRMPGPAPEPSTREERSERLRIIA